MKESPDDEVVVPSRGVAREIHAQAVRDDRNRVLKRLPFVLLAAILWGRWAHWQVETLPFFLVGLSVLWTTSAGVDWWRLRNADPVEAVKADRLQKIELTRHEQRLLSTTLAMTYGLVSAISAVWVVQILTGNLPRSIAIAGLIKPAAKAGQWWRLLTGTYLHGSLLHFWGNMAALRGLGGTIESYDRRLRVPLVYLASALGGSIVSTIVIAKTSVGASGGIMGLCGYLLVLASRQPHVAPAWIRSWMLAAFGGTAALGLFGFFFIDNAAHIGGALTGLLCGALLIPAEGEQEPPGRDRLSDALGWIAAAILLGGAAFTVRRLILG
jgi:membrane associated rhomboid family serine protease